jgi:hypothetical protein
MQSNCPRVRTIGQCHIAAPNSTARVVAVFTLSALLCLVIYATSESSCGPWQKPVRILNGGLSVTIDYIAYGRTKINKYFCDTPGLVSIVQGLSKFHIRK